MKQLDEMWFARDETIVSYSQFVFAKRLTFKIISIILKMMIGTICNAKKLRFRLFHLFLHSNLRCSLTRDGEWSKNVRSEIDQKDRTDIFLVIKTRILKIRTPIKSRADNNKKER
jgi:hypothetical protein